MAASNEQLCGLILVNSGWLMQPSQPCASLSTQLAKPRPHYLSPLDAFSETAYNMEQLLDWVLLPSEEKQHCPSFSQQV